MDEDTYGKVRKKFIATDTGGRLNSVHILGNPYLSVTNVAFLCLQVSTCCCLQSKCTFFVVSNLCLL